MLFAPPAGLDRDARRALPRKRGVELRVERHPDALHQRTRRRILDALLFEGRETHAAVREAGGDHVFQRETRLGRRRRIFVVRNFESGTISCDVHAFDLVRVNV
jgi:hypothetical protein